MSPFAAVFTEEAASYIKKLPAPERKTIQDAVDLILKDPERPGTRLRGEFSSYFRLKKRRYRIFYKVDREAFTVTIIFIGYRKAGDPKDAYRLFAKWLAKKR